nr:thiol peroxidase [Candidatus Omnitrophota bacterium]
MTRNVTFKGNPLTLVGRPLKEGQRAPDFRVVDTNLKEVTLADFAGKIKVITFFPSIDTPVCDLQVKEFNKSALKLSAASGVVVLGISKDLPFAQKRFCADNAIDAVRTLSDYQTSSFGLNYGVLIKELNLLARGALIVDVNDIIRYIQIVSEVTTPPDYQDVLNHLKQVIASPAQKVEAEALPSHCQPCEGGIAALGKDKVEQLLARFRGWEVVENKKIVKEFKFSDYREATY